MNLSRIHRLLKLLGLLQSGRGHNAKSLAEACDVSRRTTYRDLKTLKQSGVPLVFDDESQRYHIPGTYFLPPTNFSLEEAMSVIVLCHELSKKNQLPFYESARNAAVKLENILPSQLRKELRKISGALHIQLDAVNQLSGKDWVFHQLTRAIQHRRCVRMVYSSPTEEKTFRTKLCPYKLLFSRRSWYVIGHSTFHRARRTFNVGRIKTLETLTSTYKIPPAFNLERYLKNAWHLIPESGPDHAVVIRFSKKVATNVSEVLWHKTQHTVRNDDGTLDFHVKVSGLNEISWWILGYGDQAEVIQPRNLRDMIVKRAQGMVNLYIRSGSE